MPYGTLPNKKLNEVSKTDVDWIINRLEGLNEIALNIRDKAFSITHPSTKEERATTPENEAEAEPGTFTDRTKYRIENIQEILTDALAALGTFI